MTRRARLDKLEGAQQVGQPGQLVIWEADLVAGVWRDAATGQAGPALREDERGEGLVKIVLEGEPAKRYAGVRWEDV